MKPGDMIEWTCKLSGCLVHKDETLRSSVEERFVPIGSGMVHLLVSIDDRTYSWINAKGLFHARVDDSYAAIGDPARSLVVPRIRANL